MTFGNINSYIIPMIVLSLFILIGNPLIVMTIMGLSGYKKRTGFVAGLTVAQISEFSLILITLGISVGHLNPEILSFATFVGLITITGSSYMIIYSEKIYSKISKYINIFEKKTAVEKAHAEEEYNYVVFGYNRLGYGVSQYLRKRNKKFLVIDYNPETVNLLIKEKINHIYGDAGDAELIDDLDFSKVKMVVSTVNSYGIDMFLINKIKKANNKTLVVLVSEDINEALKFYNAGADYVIMPKFLSTYDTNNLIALQESDKEKIDRERFNHIDYLKNLKLRKGTGNSFEFLDF